ncbi:hypothetical protein CPC08DRAFT_762942 [Agrocybe pediades]|nr:hypothetical protein CPC08DRAFT_762942 [Agrocybe pediades]
MSTPDDFPYSIAQQKAFISADLHATLLSQFLFGIYTAIFAVALHIYVHKETRVALNNWVVIGSLTALYTMIALDQAGNWFAENVVHCKQGETRVTTFVQAATGALPKGAYVAIDIAGFGVFLFADGLLVWRCLRAYGQSLRASLLPTSLFVVETVLVISATVYKLLIDTKPGFEAASRDEINDRLHAAMLVSVALTSVVATFMICRQIYVHTTPGSRARKSYHKVIDALIQSSGLYSIIVIFLAILGFLENGEFQNAFMVAQLMEYVGTLTFAVSGIAPTLMIARLFAEPTYEATDISSVILPSELAAYTFPPDNISTFVRREDIQMSQIESFRMLEEEADVIKVEDRLRSNRSESDV